MLTLLLQPPFEAFQLFDDVILVTVGKEGRWGRDRGVVEGAGGAVTKG